MDEKLSHAIEVANFNTSLTAQRHMYKTKFDNDCLYAHNGGLFEITENLLTYVDLLIRREHVGFILIDMNNNPIMVDNLETFFSDILEKYSMASNSYYASISKLRRKRMVSRLVQK